MPVCAQPVQTNATTKPTQLHRTVTRPMGAEVTIERAGRLLRCPRDACRDCGDGPPGRAAGDVHPSDGCRWAAELVLFTTARGATSSWYAGGVCDPTAFLLASAG